MSVAAVFCHLSLHFLKFRFDFRGSIREDEKDALCSEGPQRELNKLLHINPSYCVYSCTNTRVRGVFLSRSGVKLNCSRLISPEEMCCSTSTLLSYEFVCPKERTLSVSRWWGDMQVTFACCRH